MAPGRHYCAGYHHTPPYGLHWFESENGRDWGRRGGCVNDSQEDQPDECYLEILPDGTATMLMRCEGGLKQPRTLQGRVPVRGVGRSAAGRPPDRTGMLTVDGEVYISGRWDPVDLRIHAEEDHAAHTGVSGSSTGNVS